ncbi:MAG TPA: NADH-quinone oxidoreductase subunit NuoH [Myxococcota bacterium]|nr:NADH-quinone oxidoreductase subunit NuoH [Myxococcota bacterium]HRY96550.1 NADH-quinone oxidoreductase subunit NuoH [Myxococcota bacterium]HSA21898.1 NADH-quinone oxidoreductase subunit NuoH [Myxococcota bacterium]
MESLVQHLSARWSLGPWGQELLAAAAILLVAALVFVVALTYAGIITWVERRVAGRTQSRVGPNRVGPFGFLQWLADGAKMILKEDVIPAQADGPMFRLAPYACMLGVFTAFVSVPFGQLLIAADLNVGILFLLAITSLVVVGVLMAGWASNNKWSLLGGVRSAAQIVSYELPAGLAVLVVVLGAGSLSMQDIVRAQGGAPWNWFVFRDPFCLVAFFLYFTAAVAEGNRTPFDLPEAESELVAGYNTEYSGIRFGGFFLGEFANIYLLSAIATSLFLGGWQVPGVSPAEQAGSVWLQLLGFAIFFAKAWALVFVVVWLRWTLPRLRVDQLMGLCYRYLIPLAFACLLGTSLLLLAVVPGSALDLGLRLGTTGLGALGGALFAWRVAHHIRRAGDRVSLDVLQRGARGAFDPAWQTRRYGAFRKAARGQEER